MLAAKLRLASFNNGVALIAARSLWAAVAGRLHVLRCPSTHVQNNSGLKLCRAYAEAARELAEPLSEQWAADEVVDVLKQHWGYSHFRYSQEAVVRSVLRGEDNLVVMATGCGKSICFQVPALVSNRICIVISPLISLMEDQVSALNARKIPACYLGSAQSSQEVRKAAWEGEFLFLYVTPELVANSLPKFAQLHEKRGIGMIAIDEAHCISEWGHDFRPEYRLLGKLHEVLPDVPILALTATATEYVRQDIFTSLHMRPNTQITVDSFERLNLTITVRKKAKPQCRALLDVAFEQLVHAAAGGTLQPTLIYALSVSDVKKIAAALSQHLPGRVGCYHAQLEPEQRHAAHAAFLRDDLDVMVATIAYGMGIDKPNIRHVIHYGRPASIESYYQQAGRAGRDGQPSHCTLLWSAQDIIVLDMIKEPASLSKAGRDIYVQGTNDMEAYCTSTNCRHAQLVNHFAKDHLQLQGHCRTRCDNCLHGVFPTQDFAREAMLFLSAVYGLRSRYGRGRIIDLLQGSANPQRIHEWMLQLLTVSPEKEPLYGIGGHYSKQWWMALAGLLLNERLIEYRIVVRSTGEAVSIVSLTRAGLERLRVCTPLPRAIPTGMAEEEECKMFGGKDKALLLLQQLKEARKAHADTLSMAPGWLVDDTTLIALVRRQRYFGKEPLTLEQMRTVPGMSDQAVVMFGPAIQAVTAQHFAPASRQRRTGARKLAAMLQTPAASKQPQAAASVEQQAAVQVGIVQHACMSPSAARASRPRAKKT